MSERDRIDAGATGELQGKSPLNSPPRIPDYELLRRIGGGSYGEVWLARSATGVLRALKIVWRHTFEDDRPFQREFEGIQRFERLSREHPSQLALFHVGRGEGYFYYVMELADSGKSVIGNQCSIVNPPPSGAGANAGHLPPKTSPLDTDSLITDYSPHTLRADLQTQGRLPAARVQELGLALTEALSHLHKNGLVHRDIKPSNIIFVNGRPKLADIGLVTDVGDSRSIVGTEGYLPLEGPGTPQADIFALGKVLYEATTGLDRRRFPRLPDDLRSWPDAKEVFELNEINLKACETDPRRRYQSAEAVRADLAMLQRGESIKHKRAWERQRAWTRRAFITLSVLALLATVAGLLLRGYSVRDPYPEGLPSANLEARIPCDHAMNILRDDRYDEFPAAYTNFAKAIERDPHFARPYIGLLELAILGSNPDVRGPLTNLRLIARKLTELAPTIAPTYCARSVVSFYDFDFPAAERLGLRATKVNPDYELGHTWYGWMLLCWGRPAEARVQMEICASNAPAKSIGYRALANVYFAERDFTDAIAWYGKALEVEAHHAIAFEGIGYSFQALGDYTNAMKNLEAEDLLGTHNKSEVRQRYEELRKAYAERGIRGYWEQRLRDTGTNNLYLQAVAQVHLDNTNVAVNLLEESFHERQNIFGVSDRDVTCLLFDPDWDGLHDHPRFKALLRKIGFTKVMPKKK